MTMMQSPLNLASRPIRNDRLAAVLFLSAAVLLAIASVYHVMLARRVWPRRSAELRQEVVGLRKEMENLRTQSGRMQEQPVTQAQKAEWHVIHDLINQRTFRWSQLFASLEDALPPEARITSVSPHVKQGAVGLDLNARLETSDARLNFVRALDTRPDYRNVYPASCSDTPGSIECSYVMTYLPNGKKGK
jgi:Tfp pilus assembly protein PilN